MSSCQVSMTDDPCFQAPEESHSVWLESTSNLDGTGCGRTSWWGQFLEQSISCIPQVKHSCNSKRHRSCPQLSCIHPRKNWIDCKSQSSGCDSQLFWPYVPESRLANFDRWKTEIPWSTTCRPRESRRTSSNLWFSWPMDGFLSIWNKMDWFIISKWIIIFRNEWQNKQ